MKNTNKKGFVLAETLIVTTIVASFLIYMFVQLTNLKSSYDISLKSNTVESLYALSDIIDFLNGDSDYKDYITSGIDETSIIRLSSYNCNAISSTSLKSTCNKLNSLINYEKISDLYISYNSIDDIDFSSFTDLELKKVIMNAKVNMMLDYRLSAKFTDGTSATVGW